jgi:type III pantothenate kinase
MLLAVDLRNNSAAVGVRGPDGWLARFRLAAAERSADEWSFLIGAMLRAAGVDPASLRRAALSSVVPAATQRFRAALAALVPQATPPLVVGPGVKTGLRIRTDQPGEVGADLVCSAAAAVARVGAPCLAVDFGTALSITAVDASGDLVGAIIAPGLETAGAALRDKAAQLPQVHLETPVRAIGRNTADAVRSGLLLGWAGLVDRLVAEAAAELSPAGAVGLVGSGDYPAPPVATHRPFAVWEPWLALEGLALIADRNRPNQD